MVLKRPVVLACLAVALVGLLAGIFGGFRAAWGPARGTPGGVPVLDPATGGSAVKLLESLDRDTARNPKDGSILVRVPKGPFLMGTDDSEAFDDEKPRHQVDVEEFWIGKYAVTNEQFQRFVTETGYDAGRSWKDLAAKWGPTAPVVYVSYDDAQAYCRWAGLRLPTEAWREKAARGTKGWKFPWGDPWDPKLAWSFENSDRKAHPVDSLPEGASPYGCLNMAGNVWEWTSTIYKPYPYKATDGREEAASRQIRVLRGGAWYTYSGSLRCSRRCPERLQVRGISLGFRVAARPAPGPSTP